MRLSQYDRDLFLSLPAKTLLLSFIGNCTIVRNIIIYITIRYIYQCDRKKKLIFTQKCAMTLTLKDRSIKWSGVSNNIRPETTPALLNKRVTSPMRFLISSAILYTSSFFDISTTYPLQKPPIEVIILQVSSIAKKMKFVITKI